MKWYNRISEESNPGADTNSVICVCVFGENVYLKNINP
jgi:hypothetical protein